MARVIPPWLPRVLLGGAVVLVAVWVGLGWLHANQIRSEFLVPRSHLAGPPVEVVGNEAGRVLLERGEASEREGTWGLRGDTSYAQMSTIVRIDDATVERGMTTLEGEVAIGDAMLIDPDAFTGDPLTAHRIGFEELITPSDIGPHPGWFIDGRRSTWVVFIHGRGDDRLTESLRLIPSLVEDGYPVMVTSYRNDVGATPSDGGLRTWGLDEWRDVEAVVALGQRKGAKDFVLIGSGFGASIVSMFLHESDLVGVVRAVVYESPVLDLEEVVRSWSAASGTPRVVGWLGRRLATARFAIDWEELDQPSRAEEFDVPMLLLAGGEDAITDPDDTEAFAEALGDQATYERFEQAAHTDLWNIDRARYEATIRLWLANVIGPE